MIEHYRNDGLLTAVIEAGSATDGYTSVLAAGLVGRLDHAAYLGRELARAEHALRSGTRYQQDAAPGVTPIDSMTLSDGKVRENARRAADLYAGGALVDVRGGRPGRGVLGCGGARL